MATYQESTSGTLPFYNEAIEDLLKRGQTQLTGALTGGAPLQQVAGLDPLQQQAMQLAGSEVGAYQPMLNAAQQSVAGARDAYSGLTGGVDPGLTGTLGAITSAGMPLYQQAAGLYTSGAQFDPSRLGGYLNPYLGGVVDEIGRLGQERLEQQMLPALTGQFSSLGQFGSARQAAMLADAAKQSQREVLGTQSTALNQAYNQAMQDYLNWSQQQNAAAQGLAGLGSQQAQQQLAAGQLGQNAYQAAQNLALQQAQAQAGTALDMGSSLGNLAQAGQQMGLTDIGTLTAAGQLGQQQQQAQLTAQYQNQLAQQQYPWQQLGNYAQLFGAGTPQASSSWETSFKKGGLARYADGGRFQENDLIEDQLQQLLAPRPMGANPYADQAMNMRQQLIGQLPTSPAFTPVREPSMGEALGEAMMRASAQGPANLGQLIGRSGASYFDAEKERGEKNRETALNRLLIEQRALPSISSGVQRSLGGPTPEQLRTVYTSARNEAAQIAKDYQFPSAEARSAWIEQQAMATTENYLQNFATQPLGPRGGNLPMKGSALPLGAPGVETPSQPTRAPARDRWPSAFNEPRVKFDSPSPDLSSLNMKGTPESVRAELETLQEPDRAEALRALKASQAPAEATSVPSPPPRDKRAEQYKSAYGGEEGKALFKERENLNALFGTNASMVNQLNLLENLYSNPNLPEGELGPLLQKIRSGFQTFGVDVGDTTGPADLANAVAQKMVLAQRTSDGTNLLPGAVSNFEVQLLQSMGPTLSLTNGGRQALVKFMKEVAMSNQRIAEEGSTFAAQNNEMLTPAWYKRKERVMLEEMARMKRLSDRIMMQFSNREKGAQ